MIQFERYPSNRLYDSDSVAAGDARESCGIQCLNTESRNQNEIEDEL